MHSKVTILSPDPEFSSSKSNVEDEYRRLRKWILMNCAIYNNSLHIVYNAWRVNQLMKNIPIFFCIKSTKVK